MSHGPMDVILCGTSHARTHLHPHICAPPQQRQDQQPRRPKKENLANMLQLLYTYHTVIPIAIETLGPMGPQAKVFLLELGRRLKQQTCEPRSTSYISPAADLNGHPKGKCCGHDGIIASGGGEEFLLEL